MFTVHFRFEELEADASGIVVQDVNSSGTLRLQFLQHTDTVTGQKVKVAVFFVLCVCVRKDTTLVSVNELLEE